MNWYEYLTLAIALVSLLGKSFADRAAMNTKIALLQQTDIQQASQIQELKSETAKNEDKVEKLFSQLFDKISELKILIERKADRD